MRNFIYGFLYILKGICIALAIFGGIGLIFGSLWGLMTLPDVIFPNMGDGWCIIIGVGFDLLALCIVGGIVSCLTDGKM